MAISSVNVHCPECRSRVALTVEQTETLYRTMKATFYCLGCKDDRTTSLLGSGYGTMSHDDSIVKDSIVKTVDQIKKPKPPRETPLLPDFDLPSVPVIAHFPEPPFVPPKPDFFPEPPPVDFPPPNRPEAEAAPPPFDRPGLHNPDAFAHPGQYDDYGMDGLPLKKKSSAKQLLLIGLVLLAAVFGLFVIPWGDSQAKMVPVIGFLPAPESASQVPTSPTTATTPTTTRGAKP